MVQDTVCQGYYDVVKISVLCVISAFERSLM